MKSNLLFTTLAAGVLVFTGGCATDDQRMGNMDTMSHSRTEVGDTPPALADLVGARAGQAEGALMQRGYENRGGSKSADSSYTNWEEMNTGECVTIHTMDGRYESIIYGSKADCN